jgi:hypothetical protein
MKTKYIAVIGIIGRGDKVVQGTTGVVGQLLEESFCLLFSKLTHFQRISMVIIHERGVARKVAVKEKLRGQKIQKKLKVESF